MSASTDEVGDPALTSCCISRAGGEGIEGDEFADEEPVVDHNVLVWLCVWLFDTGALEVRPASLPLLATAPVHLNNLP